MKETLFVLFVMAGAAFADGRAPGTSTIHFQRGAEQNIAAGMTFGLLLSHDGGSTWSWMCEAAVGYGGTYDPSYSYTRAGSVFGTTFKGLAVMRDGCSFTPAPTTCPLASRCTFVSADATDAAGHFFYAAADATDAKVYRSTDDGASYPQVGSPGQDHAWWQSLVVAPSDDARVYLAGVSNIAPRHFLLFVSRDGGASFAPAAAGSAVTTAQTSLLEIASVDPNDANTLYFTTTDNAPQQHLVYGLWRSTDAGSSAVRILSSQDAPVSAVARRNHDLVAATKTTGVMVSHDRGSSWSPPLPQAPHINCLAENSAGEVWACTHDDAGIMKTTDLATWTKVLRYEDIVGPVSCGSGTTQQDTCVRKEWCTLKQQLQIASTAVDCPAPPAASRPPGPAGTPRASSGGCCDGGGGDGALGFGGVAAVLLWRRRTRGSRAVSSGCRT